MSSSIGLATAAARPSDEHGREACSITSQRAPTPRSTTRRFGGWSAPGGPARRRAGHVFAATRESIDKTGGSRNGASPNSLSASRLE